MINFLFTSASKHRLVKASLDWIRVSLKCGSIFLDSLGVVSPKTNLELVFCLFWKSKIHKGGGIRALEVEAEPIMHCNGLAVYRRLSKFTTCSSKCSIAIDEISLSSWSISCARNPSLGVETKFNTFLISSKTFPGMKQHMLRSMYLEYVMVSMERRVSTQVRISAWRANAWFLEKDEVLLIHVLTMDCEFGLRLAISSN